MTTRSDQAEFEEFDADPLKLPIGGRVYTIPPVGIRTALILNKAVMNSAEALAELSKDDNYFRMLLGDAYDQMIADDVPTAAVDRAALTQLVDFRHGRESAQIAWKTGADPEALAAMMAATQMILDDAALPATTPAVAARSTNGRSSGSGTSTKRAAKPHSRRKR